MPLDKNDIKQLIAILQKGLDSEDINTSDVSIKNKSTTKHKKNIKKNTYNSVGERENKFLSLGLDKLHKEDSAIDKKLNINPPTPRNRPASLIGVRCRVCGKEDEIPSSLIYESIDRYKCNKCSSSPG